jgi:hypothetical protein
VSTSSPVAGPSFAKDIKTSVLVAVSAAAVACGMTLLFLGMRSVMEIGGACAEGGPFVPVRPAPKVLPAR